MAGFSKPRAVRCNCNRINSRIAPGNHLGGHWPGHRPIRSPLSLPIILDQSWQLLVNISIPEMWTTITLLGFVCRINNEMQMVGAAKIISAESDHRQCYVKTYIIKVVGVSKIRTKNFTKHWDKSVEYCLYTVILV